MSLRTLCHHVLRFDDLFLALLQDSNRLKRDQSTSGAGLTSKHRDYLLQKLSFGDRVC